MNRAVAHRATVTGDRGPWLVFGHGIGGRPADWDRCVAAFADDYRVLTFAQAGSVDADPQIFSPTRHGNLLGFADDLSMLCGELGVREAVYVGHSLAATAGVIAAVGDPGLFTKLVLIGGSPCYVEHPGYQGGFTTEAIEAMLKGMAVDYDTWAAGFGPEMMANADRPELGLEFVRSLRSLDPQMAITIFRAAFGSDFRDVYTRANLPALVLQTRQDPAVPMSVAEWIAATIPSAHLTELHSAGHFPHIVDPGEVIDAITPFLAVQPAASA